MFAYKLYRKVRKPAVGTVDKNGLPKVDKDGKEITINYFRDKRDLIMKICAIICNILGGASLVGFMVEVSQLADTLSGANTGSAWQMWIVYMIFTCLFLGFIMGLGTFLTEWSAERQLLVIRKKFLHEVMRQDMSYFDGYDATALSSQLTLNTRMVRDLSGIRTSTAYFYLGLVVAALRQSFASYWKVASVSLCTLPFVVIAGVWAGNIESRTQAKVKEANEEADSVALEALSSIRIVKAFNLQDAMRNRYRASADFAYNQASQAALKSGVGYGIYWCLIFTSSAIGYWYGAKFLRDQIAAGCTEKNCSFPGKIITTFVNVVVASYFIGKIIPWVSDMRSAVRAIRETVALYDRNSLVDPFAEGGIEDLSNVQGEIQFTDVGFAYPTRSEFPVFKHLNLTIPAGKSVALVGASGCGKSTVIQLIMRFYDAQSGTVALDNIPIQDYNIGELRKIIGFVSQEPKLFATTIKANIQIGKPDATEEEIVQAAKHANAHDFIESLPEKYETYVGEGGGQLSGGQKQRIAIARALIRKPKILILDEATSALDNKSEKVVQDTLDQIVAETKITTIIIAHRLSTIRNADKIIVLNPNPETGSLVQEEGSHDELSKIENGIYAALVHMQKMPEEETEEDDALMFSQNESNVVGYSAYQPVGSRASRQFGSGRVNSLQRNMSKDMDGVQRASSLVLDRDYKPPSLFRRTAQPIQRSWYKYALGVLGSVLYYLTWPIFGYCFGLFMQTYVKLDFPDQIRTESFRNMWVMIGVGFGAFFGFWAQRYFITDSGQTIVRKVRVKTYGSMLRQEIGFFDQTHRSPARLSGILRADTMLLGEWIAGNTSVWIGTTFALLMGWGACMYANVKLGMVCLSLIAIIVPLSYIASILISSGGNVEFWKKGADKLTILSSDMSAFVTNVVMNIRTVTAYGMQTQLEAEFDAMVAAMRKEGRKRAILASVANGLINMIRLLSFTLLFYYGAKLVTKNELAGNDMLKGIMAFLLAALQCGRSLAGSVPYSLGKSAAREAWLINDRCPAIDEDNVDGLRLTAPLDSVHFDHVAFKYPTRPNLPIYRDVSFTVPAGKSVALVGASGCGKSTAVQLMERFYDVFSLDSASGKAGSFGTLKINGVDIRDYYLKALRSKIGLVSQEPALFAGTVRQNILYGNPEATEADVEEACRKANAWGFIQDMPDGLDTEVGRGGSRLSGGQKQRVAIARALVRNPQLLILDEATSALDAESERVVQDALNKLLETKAFNAVVIAHRLSTIKDCDQIVVFVNMGARGSRIAEIGTHNQLMAIPNGVYRSLVRIAEGTEQ